MHFTIRIEMFTVKMLLKNSLGSDFITVQNWATHHIRFNIVNDVSTLLEYVVKLL